MLVRILHDNGYQATIAPDAATALHAASQSSFAVILLDQGLPDMTGTELVAELRRRGNHTPALMLTACSCSPPTEPS